MLERAGIPDDYIVDVKDHPLETGEHATEQWRRLADLSPRAPAVPPPTPAGTVAPGAYLRVSASQAGRSRCLARSPRSRRHAARPRPGGQQAHHAPRIAPARGQSQVLADRALGCGDALSARALPGTSDRAARHRTRIPAERGVDRGRAHPRRVQRRRRSADSATHRAACRAPQDSSPSIQGPRTRPPRWDVRWWCCSGAPRPRSTGPGERPART